MHHGTLSFRITLILVISFVALQIAVFAVAGGTQSNPDRRSANLPAPAQVRAMVEAIDTTLPERRPFIVSAFDGALYHVELEPRMPTGARQSAMVAPYRATLPTHAIAMTGREPRFPAITRLNPWPGWLGKPLTLHVKLGYGGALAIESRPSPPVRSLLRQRAFMLGLGGIVALIALTLAVRATTRPIVRLAEDIRHFAGRPDTPDLQISGSREIRDLASAYNEMKARIAELIAERTRILAAIAHDMRTYITRFRLRAEFIGDPEQLERAVRDLDEMAMLLDDTLLLAQSATPALNRNHRLDLVDELQRFVALREEMGQVVALSLPDDAAWVIVDPLALRRILGNLVDNALYHGIGARISLRAADVCWLLRVEDDGPGVPAAMLEKLGEPFGRIDPSRDRSNGGAGLGLAIVRALVAAQGGNVTFANRTSGGFVVSVLLPT